MLKRSINSVIFICAFGLLYCSGQISLADNLETVSPPSLVGKKTRSLGQRIIFTDYVKSQVDSKVVNHTLSNNSETKISIYIEDLIAQPTEIKISLKRRRLTLYRGKSRIKSYPIAVGRRGWETPIGNFQVLEMLKNPTWIHPITGKAIAGGKPQNPLGNYWIGFWTNGHNWVGFHGTPNPESVGKAVSHGCIRMYNKDIKELFHQVSPGTPVTVVR
ncbi:L,D-transpeptidase [Cylindrospermum stagnale]|nr:L,D-transpeptidase [Cylindrospermum stagnale]